MSRTKSGVATTVSLIGLMLASQAHAESGGNDQEIALLRQQLRLLEQKLDKLQKQTSANTTAAANANAKVDATAKVANANAAIPVKGPVAPSGAIVTMPGNRPTICTDDGLNCVAITGRIHLDGGGYDYHPNTAATVPQRLDNGVNARRARIGLVGLVAPYIGLHIMGRQQAHRVTQGGNSTRPEVRAATGSMTTSQGARCTKKLRNLGRASRWRCVIRQSEPATASSKIFFAKSTPTIVAFISDSFW